MGERSIFKGFSGWVSDFSVMSRDAPVQWESYFPRSVNNIHVSYDNRNSGIPGAQDTNRRQSLTMAITTRTYLDLA